MTADQTPHTFQVDLRGVVDLLSHHLYSSPRVYLRELLQNAVDAITARRAEQPDAPAQVRLYADDGRLRVEDSGIGLTEKDVHSLLATIGRGSGPRGVRSRLAAGRGPPALGGPAPGRAARLGGRRAGRRPRGHRARRARPGRDRRAPGDGPAGAGAQAAQLFRSAADRYEAAGEPGKSAAAGSPG